MYKISSEFFERYLVVLLNCVLLLVMVYFPWFFYTVITVWHFLVKLTGIYTKHIIIYVNNRLKYEMKHNYQVTGFPLTLWQILKKLLFEFVKSHSLLIHTFCISMLCVNNACVLQLVCAYYWHMIWVVF